MRYQHELPDAPGPRPGGVFDSTAGTAARTAAHVRARSAGVIDTSRRRRYAIMSEGAFGELASKTALGVIRYGRDAVVAVIDSSRAGKNVSQWLGPRFDIPVVSSIGEALLHRPDSLLIGIAPPGGRIPADWRQTIAEAINAGLDVVSGLHEFLADDAEFAAAARAHGTAIIDHRRPPQRMEVARGRQRDPGSVVVLTVGSDCAIGKMTVALELRRAAVDRGERAVFVPTGQTGIMIDGWGVAVDRVIADFVQGTVEWLVEEAEGMGDLAIVEGQGSIDHPAYSSVMVGLIHGARPDGMVLVHEAGREFHHGWEERGSRIKPLPVLVRAYEDVAALVAPSKVVAVALNTSNLPEGPARRALAEVEDETGLPADDPVRFGAERILDAVRELRS